MHRLKLEPTAHDVRLAENLLAVNDPLASMTSNGDEKHPENLLSGVGVSAQVENVHPLRDSNSSTLRPVSPGSTKTHDRIHRDEATPTKIPDEDAVVPVSKQLTAGGNHGSARNEIRSATPPPVPFALCSYFSLRPAEFRNQVRHPALVNSR